MTPQQALSLLNNRFVLRHCEHLAARVQREAFWTTDQIDRALPAGPRSTAGRRRGRPADRLREPPWRARGVCRLLVNCNDFLFVH